MLGSINPFVLCARLFVVVDIFIRFSLALETIANDPAIQDTLVLCHSRANIVYLLAILVCAPFFLFLSVDLFVCVIFYLFLLLAGFAYVY